MAWVVVVVVVGGQCQPQRPAEHVCGL